MSRLNATILLDRHIDTQFLLRRAPLLVLHQLLARGVAVTERRVAVVEALLPLMGGHDPADDHTACLVALRVRGLARAAARLGVLGGVLRHRGCAALRRAADQ